MSLGGRRDLTCSESERPPARRRKPMTDHTIGTREEWLAAREQLLVREKEHTRLGDELAQLRRELPWVRVEKEYRFDTDDGEKTLGELFDGRSQLLVYHFMFGPSYEAGCPVNSSIADSIDGVAPAPARPRRDVRPRLAGAAGEAAGLQAPDGLESSLGLVRAQRLQLRPRLLAHGGAGPRGRSADALREDGRASADRRAERPRDRAPTSPGTSPRARVQRVRAGRRRPSTTRTRRRGADWSS